MELCDPHLFVLLAQELAGRGGNTIRGTVDSTLAPPHACCHESQRRQREDCTSLQGTADVSVGGGLPRGLG